MFKQITLLSLAILLPFNLSAMQKSVERPEKKVLVFDLGGLFLDLKKKTMGMEGAGDGSKIMGALNVASYAVRDRQNPFVTIKKKFFQVLDSLDLGKEPVGYERSRDDKGDVMPYALCVYQEGRKTAAQMRELCDEACNRFAQEKRFTSEREEYLVRNTLKTTFTPSKMASYVYALTDAVALLKKLASMTDADGKKKFIIIPLSNWDGESFALVRQMFPDIISCFDASIISGEERVLKPNEAAYRRIEQMLEELCRQGKIDRKYLDKKYWTFFDDQQNNVSAAEALGIESYKVEKNNVASLANALVNAGVLEESDVPVKPVVTEAGVALIAVVVLAALYYMTQS